MTLLDDLDLSTVRFPRLGNHEFIALYLAKNGPTRWKCLRDALLSWRGMDPRSVSRGHFSIYFTPRNPYCRGYRGDTPDADVYWWHPPILSYVPATGLMGYQTSYDKAARDIGFQLTVKGASFAAKALAKIMAKQVEPEVDKKARKILRALKKLCDRERASSGWSPELAAYNKALEVAQKACGLFLPRDEDPNAR